ncbi:glycosyltransferase family 39 protein [Plantactinospora siamensis]|uniref:Glycosyltransferase family 39 protein n=1 Tax=Plantactinospora siamensis TaxID=555372 RepID=A0ABV6NX85_9ACTN
MRSRTTLTGGRGEDPEAGPAGPADPAPGAPPGSAAGRAGAPTDAGSAADAGAGPRGIDSDAAIDADPAADGGDAGTPPGTPVSGPPAAGAAAGGPAVRAALDWARRLYWLWPALATLAVTAVGIGRAEPWRDEMATWSAATRPFYQVLRMAHHVDAVTSPYYLFMWAWIRIAGDSPTAMRLPSLIAMVGTAGLLAVLGRRLFGVRVGVAAGLLFAVLPATSRYAQEARGYAFAALFSVASTLLLVRALDRPTRRRFLGYGLALYGLGLANLLMLMVLVGHAVAVLTASRVTSDRRPLWRWLTAVVAVGVGVFPLVWLGRHQQGTQLNWVPLAKIELLPDLPGGLFGNPTAGGFVVGLAAVGWALRGRWGAVLGMAALGPVVLLYEAGQHEPLFVARYLIFAAPLLALLAATNLERVRPAAILAIVSVLAFVSANSQLGFRKTHEWPRSAPRSYSAAARIVEEHELPGDGIIFPNRSDWSFLDIAMSYYLRDRAPRDVLVNRTARQRGTLWASECRDPVGCLAGTNRVWVVSIGEKIDPFTTMPAAKAAALRTGYALNSRWTVPDLTITLYVRR